MSQPVHTKPPEMAPQRAPESPAPKKNTWYKTAVEIGSGGAGGAAGIYAATPFIYLKTYMQQRAINPHGHPVFQKNPAKWFAGGVGLAGWMFPQAALTFALNGWMRQKLSKDGERELTGLEKLACSSMTGAVLTVFVAPQELIWTQQKRAEDERQKMIKEQKLDPKQVPTKSGTQIAQEIWKKHGIRGFYRAGGETMGREIVSASILTYLAAEHPFLAPVIGAAISQPLDGRKTAKQYDFGYKASLRKLFRIKAFSGLLLGRIPIYLVFMNAAPYVKDKCQEWMLPKAQERAQRNP
jgi:hypothetical protein